MLIDKKTSAINDNFIILSSMVRAGVVDHPSQWPHGGYHEIQVPRRKKIIISYRRLRELAGFEDYESFVLAHHKWVQAALKEIDAKRERQWTESIAVGSSPFIERSKESWPRGPGIDLPP